MTHRSSSIGLRDTLLSPHQSFFTGAGNPKSLFQASGISHSVTSIVNTIGLQTVFQKQHSLSLQDSAVFSEFIDDHLVTCDSFQLIWAMFLGTFIPYWIPALLFLSGSFGSQCWSFWFTIDRFDWDWSFAWWDRFLMGTTLTIACHSPWLRLDVILSQLAVFSWDVTLLGWVLSMPFDS